ncbi:peptide deformylase [Blattabacterium sp. (Blattella germanica) str. Bge]|uniref:peptide deformylase n=1 Tax=Blattabacterium sp. (Blattella germanica) TaxID=624186 RepID=UPI0001BB620E|nr:peptide deformylase [Blattabacterium sp. (Blattella germanica)]ACY40472.1 peptide deformylase [Blattabacterium sp. (Blattella germanica) str. Bge]
MVLPIVIYGNPILRKKCLDIDLCSCKKEINQLIKDMFETIHQAKGIGLAAPQIGKNIRLFIVETPYLDGKYKEVFINAKILKIHGKEYKFNEGCLSIPGIMGYVKRKSNVLIEYYDHNWKKQKKTLTGICARVILHEYDHLDGKLFIDYFSSTRKKRIEKKLISLSERSSS